MRPALLGALAVVAVTAVTACGSSHRRGVSGGPRRIPASGQRYSVRQVEAAFARQGVDLHTARRQALHGFVEFQYGRMPHFITLAMYTRRVPPSLRSFRAPTGRRVKFARHVNVLAFSDPGDFAAVKSALAGLH